MVLDAHHDARTIVAMLAALVSGTVLVLVDPRTPAAVRAGVEVAAGAHEGGTGDLVVVTTSGTTGAPKGVRLGHTQVRASAVAVAAALGVDGSDAWLCCLPLNHVGAQAIVWRAVVTGCRIVLADGSSADAIAEACRDHDVGIASLVPTQLHRLVRGPGVPASMRELIVGGAACTPALAATARATGTRVRLSYGMSEMASTVALDGCPLPGVDVAVGEDGELWLGGPMRTPGYAWGDRLAVDAAGRFHTGDRGCVGAGGDIAVSGRLDGVFTCGGENVSPAAVRDVLAAHPDVASAWVWPQPDVDLGAVPVAAVVLGGEPGRRGDGGDPATALVSYCRQSLPGIAVPRRIDVYGNRSEDP